MTDPARLYYRYRVEGMDCASCAAAIERELKKRGALEVSLNYALQSLLIAIPAGERSESFIDAVKKIGYRLIPISSQLTVAPPPASPPTIHFIASLLLTIPLWLGMVIHISALHDPIVTLSLATAACAIGLSKIGPGAIRSAIGGYPTMETLIVIGATTSLIAGFGAYFMAGEEGPIMGHHLVETAASIITFALLGQVLEKRALAHTGEAMHDLVRLSPETAVIVRGVGANAETERVACETLKADDRVIVNAGERIPGDGIVYGGEGLTDDSLITGESELVKKERGAPVIAGTLVSSGSLKIRLNRVGEESTLGQIITLLADSQLHRPQIQRIGDSVGAVFVPAVCALSIGTVLISWILGIPFIDALLRGIAILAASCPCAVGLATPTAISVALGRAARHGILIKGGDIIEALASIKQVGFDKTGTITTGEFSVSSIEVATIENQETIRESELRSIIRSLESHSTHPIARSLTSAFSDAPLIELSSVEDRRSEGIRGYSSLGDILEIRPNPASDDTKDTAFSLIVSRNGVILGRITIEDELHFDATQVVAALHRQGRTTFLLSGDTKERVARIAHHIAVENFRAECSPTEKLEEIRLLRTKGSVLFIGDGVNDSLALSEATVGIAVRGGAETAMKSGDIILLNGQLRLIPSLLELGAATYRTIVQNLFWAFGYNLVAIPLAMGGILSPSYGALAMALSDLIVLGNSLLLAKRALPSGELS